jgi:hypothetical protein
MGGDVLRIKVFKYDTRWDCNPYGHRVNLGLHTTVWNKWVDAYLEALKWSAVERKVS